MTSPKEFARPTALLRPDGQKEGERSLVSELEHARGVDEMLLLAWTAQLEAGEGPYCRRPQSGVVIDGAISRLCPTRSDAVSVPAGYSQSSWLRGGVY